MSEPMADWTDKSPVASGVYWHWNGDEDSAPFPLHVAYSGTSGKYFVCAGQAGIQSAVDCDEYGGWWMAAKEPALPNHTRPASPALARLKEEIADGTHHAMCTGQLLGHVCNCWKSRALRIIEELK